MSDESTAEWIAFLVYVGVPFVMLLGLAVGLVWYLRRVGSFQQQYLTHMREQSEALKEIARAVRDGASAAERKPDQPAAAADERRARVTPGRYHPGRRSLLNGRSPGG